MAANTERGLLPTLTNEDEYSPLLPNDAVWLPAIRTICQRHHIPTSGLKRTVLGTHVVFYVGDCIVKLYCRFWPEDYTAEMACLSNLSGLPIPQLVATGELEEWPYLIMTIVAGIPTGKVWHTLDVEQKTAIMRDLGSFVRELHSRPCIVELPSDWRGFLRARAVGLRAHHQLSDGGLSWVRDFVEPIFASTAQPVVLNCDLTCDHVLVVQSGEKWSFSGIIDFGDAMIGHPYYDFTAPLLDHAFGEPEVAHSLLIGYGQSVTKSLIQEVSRFIFVHRFWSLTDFSDESESIAPEVFLNRLWGRDSSR